MAGEEVLVGTQAGSGMEEERAAMIWMLKRQSRPAAMEVATQNRPLEYRLRND